MILIEASHLPWVDVARYRYGNQVRIRHPSGYTTIYAHLLTNSIVVREGQRVEAGDLLGISDNTGQSTGPHLHFEVRDAQGRRVNPYGDPPDYTGGCGPGALWATCPPTPAPPRDVDHDGYSTAQGDCDDRNPRVHPGAAEVCNGVNDDCTGTADDPWRSGLTHDLGNPCSVGIGVCTATGTWTCAPNGRSTVCNAIATRPQSERCDGRDNDCNGATDEPWRSGLTQDIGNPCSITWDACRGTTTGQWICAPDGRATVCDAPDPGGMPERPEACNGIDDDCDGTTDEDDGATRLCASLPNAYAACASGACEFNRCIAGFANLDGDATNGCEYPCAEVAIPAGAATYVSSPAAAVVPMGIAVAWTDDRTGTDELYGATFGPALALLGSEQQLTMGGNAAGPVLVWQAGAHIAAWVEPGISVSLQRFDVVWAPTAPPWTYPWNSPCCPALAAASSTVALTFTYRTPLGWGGVNLVTLDAQSGQLAFVDAARDGADAAIAATSTGFAIVWRAASQHVHVRFVDAHGMPSAPDIDLGLGMTNAASAIAEGPGVTGVTWWRTFSGTTTLVLTAVDAAGRTRADVATATIAHVNPRKPALAWANGVWALAWSDGSQTTAGDASVATIDMATGRYRSRPTPISTHPHDDADPALIADPYGFVASWRRRPSPQSVSGSIGLLRRICP